MVCLFYTGGNMSKEMAGEKVQALEDGAQVPALKDGEQVQGLEDGEQLQVLEDGEQVQEMDKVPLQGLQAQQGSSRRSRGAPGAEGKLQAQQGSSKHSRGAPCWRSGKAGRRHP